MHSITRSGMAWAISMAANRRQKIISNSISVLQAVNIDAACASMMGPWSFQRLLVDGLVYTSGSLSMRQSNLEPNSIYTQVVSAGNLGGCM